MTSILHVEALEVLETEILNFFLKKGLVLDGSP